MPNKSSVYKSSVWNNYRLYGTVFRSNFPFTVPLTTVSDSAAFTFQIVGRTPKIMDWRNSEAIFENPHRNEKGESLLYVYEQPDHYIMHFTGFADYYLWQDRIICYPFYPDFSPNIELSFLGVVFAVWLEWRETLTLHGSAVSAKGNAILFLANNKGGKSSIAAELIRNNGSFLSDDLVAIRKIGKAYRTFAGYPWMRLWPKEASYFVEDPEELDRIHPDETKRWMPVEMIRAHETTCHDEMVKSIYILDKMEGAPDNAVNKIAINQLSPSEALIELTRHSYVPNISHAAQFNQARFKRLAALAQAVPVNRLSFSAGLHYLQEITSTVLNSLH